MWNTVGIVVIDISDFRDIYYVTPMFIGKSKLFETLILDF